MGEVLSFDWDGTNTLHIARHGIPRREVEEVFANNPADVGYEISLRILVAVWAIRGEAVRPVTAFEASRQLKKAYLASRGM